MAKEIEETHERLRTLVRDLESLDATLVQFDPSIQVEAIKPRAFRPPADWSRRGEMSRIILSGAEMRGGTADGARHRL